jgi:hypothetical protein
MSISLSIKLLINQQIDKKRWDETMESSQNGIVYGYSWYLDAVFPNWTALVSEDYTFIFPITSNRKFGLYYWYSPIYTMQLGLFSTQELTDEVLLQFYGLLPNSNISFDFSVNAKIQQVPNGFTTLIKTCQYIDLTSSYTKLTKAYSTNLKRNLKKANKANLRIEESLDVESVVSIFRTYRGDNLGNVYKKDYEILYNLIQHALSVQKGKIYQVYLEEELLAACFFSYANNRIIYHKGGVNLKGKKLGAMHFLIDYIVQKNEQTNYVFDFGGSSIPAVKQFNSNFCKSEYTYLQLQKGNRWITLGRKIKNKLF